MAKSKLSKNPAWHEVLSVLIEANALPGRIYLWGPPGTGKSMWATRLGEHERVTLHGSIDPSDVVGTWILADGEKGSTTSFAIGPGTRAMKHGFPLVLDEFNEAGPEIVCLLHAMLDDPPGITLPTGDRVSPPGGGYEKYKVIATSNHPPEVLPEALRNRFDLILHAGVPSPEALAQLPQEYRSLCESHYTRLQTQIQKDWAREFSYRTILSVSRLEATLGLDLAAKLVLGESNGSELKKVLAVQRSAKS